VSADPRELAYRGEPKVDAEREQAWDQWKVNYSVSCAERWIAEGTSRADAQRAAAGVYLDMSQADALPWMPLGEALQHRILSGLAGGRLEGGARVEYIRSLRTAETSTEHERTLSLAYQLGITVQQAAGLRDREKIQLERETPTPGRTSLYRHFDAAGALLYVGIAKEPDKRAEQHRYHSPWFRFVATTDVKWHPTRESAAEAERAAIETERPIFNSTHNQANRAAAIDYLFAAVEKASAA